MVFESYVVSVLNKFLGQYVENLDPSQFQMSIWGGDVKLENLVLKENALDELDLPVKVLRGHLGQLILKIPWKNLYSEPVVAKVDGVYLLARPNTDIKYDKEKEEKIKQEKKEQELTAIEEAIKYAEEAKNKSKEDKEKSLSFAEKLAMHIVKNIQVFVSNIHIRYEDTLSNEDGPFSVGITLENLSAESVDKNWQPVVVDSKQSLVNKLVRLDNLAVYLNSHDKIGKLPTRSDWVKIAKAGIAKGKFGGERPQNYAYVIEPLTSETKAKLDTNSVPNLSIPKVFVEIIMRELAIVLSRRQFKDIMRLADNFDRMKTNSQFRKYKPFVPLKDNKKAWWNYAIHAVLEEDVKRRSRNWSWEHIVNHRMTCHKYMLLYKKKLSQKKISDEVQKDIDQYEEKLDVLNITIWRKQAEIETKKEGTNYEMKEKRKQSEGGWFSGFFGKKSKSAAGLTKEEEIVEEQKLYAAIGYSESDAPVKLPPEYVAYKLKFAQKRISVKLLDDVIEPACCVAIVSLENLFMKLGYRPGAQAVSVLTKLGNLNVLGCPVENQSAPEIIRSVARDTDVAEYVNVSFETNPLGGKCDQRIRLTVQPLEVIYHANTVDNLMNFFKLPEDVQLSEISAAAYSQIDGLRNQSRTNLSYAIETRTLLDIDILVHSPFIIIPEKGILTDNCSMLVVDLGSLKVTTDPSQERITNTKSLSAEELEEKVYDRFDIELKQLQILMAKPGEDWKESRNEAKSSLHVLNPFGLNIQLYKCLAADDVRLAQIRVAGLLSTLQLHVTDKRLDDLMKLALSIPIPGEQDSTTATAAINTKPTQAINREVKTEAYVSPLNVAIKEDIKSETSEEVFQTPPESPKEGTTVLPRLLSREDEEAIKLAKAEQTNVDVKFEIVQINVTVSTQDKFGIKTPLLEVDLLKLGAQICVRQYDLTVMANVGDILVKEMIHGIDGKPLELVSTPADIDILAVKFVQADRSHPRFRETFNSTERAVDVMFASLRVVLHQEAMLNLVEFANNLLPESEEKIKPQQLAELEGSSEDNLGKTEEEKKSLAKKKIQEDEVIEVKVNARLGEFTAVITSIRGDVAELRMKQLEVGLSMLPDRITVLARMQDLSVLDGVTDARYPKIVSIVNEEVFNVEIVIFNGATEGGDYGNMEKVDTKFLMNVGRIRVIFLNRFVNNLLAFLNNFQRAQEAIQNASKTAAQNATQSLQEYNKNSPRVKLDVSIQAPLVIIPVDSQSERALVANLGNLEVHNNFEIVREGKNEDTVVVDNMAVSLSSLQLFVADISKDESIVAQRLILKPISLELTVVRSLSSWYHEIPDIDVAGQLHAVNIDVGTDDLKTALAIASQNLTEGSTIDDDVEDGIFSTSGSSLEAVETQDEEMVNVVADEEKIWVAVKFKFSIETIAARIYKNIEKLDVNDKTTWEHPAENCLGHFSLDYLNLSGSILANGAMETSVVLKTIALDDKRPALEKGVTTMIERRTDDRKPKFDSSNMIDVQFEQTKELDKQVTVLVKGMSIIINVEFLLALSTVFTEAFEEAPSEDPDSKPDKLAEARIVTTELASSSTAPPISINKNPILQVTVQIEEPEIFLLADAKQKNTNAIVVKNALDMSLKIQDEQMWFQASIQNFHMVTASFEKSRREVSQADVLRVKHISLHFSSVIGGHPHIDLNSTVVYLNVSPAFVGIATAVASSLTQSKEEDGEGSGEDVPDLFKAVDIADSNKWYLKEVARGQLVAGSRIFARAADLKSYAAGLITSIDKKVSVILDDGATWSCDVNDVSGVVLDEAPLPKEIAVGVKVIALVKEGEPMQVGVVTEVLQSSDSPNVLVRFSVEQEEVKPLEYVRLLPSVKQGALRNKPVVSSTVWCRLPDKEHYGQGFISKKDWRYQIKFANGTHMYHFINDPLAIALDHTPRREHLVVGTDVIAPIPRKPMMYPGRVKKITVSGYEIQFDNGAVHEISIYDLKMMKMAKKEGHGFKVRSLLWIKYTDNFYYRGYIDGIDNKIYVRFYEFDERRSYLLNEQAAFVRDVTPKEVMIGESVVVLKGSYGLSGVVTNVRSRESDPEYLIEGAGNEMWVPLKDVRRFEKTSVGKGAKHDLANQAENLSDNREEQFMVNVDGFVFNIEAEKGGNLISLLSMRGDLQAEVKNWQEKLNGKADLRLEANYFNEALSEWEPLIEKLETKDNFIRWELSVGFKMNQDESSDDSGAQMLLSVESNDFLELTITKTSLDVFRELGKSFSEAVTESIGGYSMALEKTAPYEIKNELGTDVYIRPGNTFKAPENMKDELVLVRSGESLMLQFARQLRLTSTSSDVESIKIAVQVEGYHEIKDVSVKKAGSSFFSIFPKKLHQQGVRSMVVQVTSPDGRKLVVLRSPLRMKNHCPVPLEIYVQKQNLDLMDTLKEDEYLNIPLTMANGDVGYFIKPGGFPYEKTVEEIRLSQMPKNGKKIFACAAPWEDADPFYVQVRCVSERYTSESGSKSGQLCYTLHYHPPVVLINYLPFPIKFNQEGLATFVNLEGGNKLPIYTVDLNSNAALNIKLESYLGKTYTGRIKLRSDLAQLSVVYLVSGSKKLVVGVYVKKRGSLEITLYSTYWLINHTGLPLEYKASDSDAIIQHPACETDVAIFAFTSKPDMFSKNTLRLRTSGSDWSDKFSLDTAGSGGSLKCKKKDGKEYGIGSEIRLSYFSLTKIVVFTPLNLLVNHTKHTISLSEAGGAWYIVKSGETIPFWPNKTPAKNLKIKTDDSPVESILFDFQSNVNILLRLDNGVGGVCATMFSKDAATVITFTSYFDGSAPLRIDNDTSLEICYRQLNSDKVYVLPPKKTTVFTWDNLQAKREVEWFVLGLEKLSAKSNLKKNDMGSLGEEDEPLCYWASFLDGLQRVLFITDSYTMAFRAQQDQLEIPSQEITLSLKGIGLSLVNNEKRIELAYLRITPSDVLWEEQKKRRRWKTMTTKVCVALEMAFNTLQNELAQGQRALHRRKVDNMTVDFETMEIIEPDRRPIRRTFHPGVWVQFNQSAHEIQLHSKINDIQMDSQVPGSTFQTLFHSIPPPKTVAASNAPKPMIEASLITRREENAIVRRMKYFKVLVQELDVKMDKGWLLELVALFGNENQDLDESNYEEDKKVVTTSLQLLNAAVTDVRNYYDYFHLSPIKVHVSFSVQGGSTASLANVGGNVVDLLLNSLGVAVADVQDVVLKLAYFELNNQIYSQSQLIQVATNHYKNQAVKQIYVLVLGLDVLGNPVGLITGLTTGAKDLFYEPYQGLIQGPEEFAEGLALGVKSLVGHTIGGAAGAVSRITGTLGKGIAALTMDDEFQESRRTSLNKKPTSVKEGLSRGGKGLLEGVYEGVTGVVTKPMEGAKKSGAKGFFKGVGKGLVGVVAKPVSGVVDFASSTLEGIKGTASGDRDVKRLRPARRFYADKIMRPYNRYDAEGVEFLKMYAKGKETLATDSYVCHYYFPSNMAIMITNKHVLLMRKETVIKNEWENVWFCRLKDLQTDPKVNGSKITFSTPEQGKMFKKTGTRAVDVKSASFAEWIAKNAIEAKALLR